MFKATDTINRMKTVVGVKSDLELSNALGAPKQTVASWRKRESIPLERLIDFAISNGASLDWLVLGAGDAARQHQQGATAAEGACTASPFRLGDGTRRAMASAMRALAADLLVDVPDATSRSEIDDLIRQAIYGLRP